MPNRERTARNWRWVLVLCGTGTLYWLVLLTMVVTANPNLFPTVLLLGALVAPVTVLAYLNWPTGHGIVDGRTVAWIAALSGVLGVLLASILEYATATRREQWPMLTVAVIEETLKILVPIGVLVGGSRAAGDSRAGLIVGVGSGAGFAVLETMGYGFSALLSSGNLATVDQTLLIRGVFAPACHLAWTGVLGAALWRLPARPVGRGVLVFAGTYVAVVLLHAAWDTFAASWPAHIVLAAVSLALLILFQRRLGGRVVR
ncbi:PrsW family glutamic-type intramembrane protease [Raineyella sp. W15-4]|uniref:PrsW family glutamic-type intramembrane protease n=1 Tax=Raineyella sp. W15-4 TaxID=3081651 RepID=UPI0029530EBF|nr:PrsW family glutamic-type intramembrane protease [Raineyella sp. W15-4]WOQ16384.1 PrsW family glutamic-type intramembrane protease [Raineyella sp. W15-4]